MANPFDRIEQLSPVKRALLEVRDMRAKLDAYEQTKTEPIAIVGLGVRLPGSVSTPDGYWRLLQEGRDAIRDIPADRWDVDACYDPDPETPGKMYARRGGFVDAVDLFDPYFFGVSPREALSLDPQQRLLLEVSWEALEHAGASFEEESAARTGVFVGITNSDYYRMLFTNTPDIDAYYASGTSCSAAAGRLSYTLGFRGPSLAVDTACSSSLVAVHLACRALRAEECDRALAGGVNLILSPELNIACSKARMLAPDGRCKTFDARADGYVRSEGCGMLVLKRLSQAVRDGDRILALIRGTAVNQDGRSSGLTVPYGPSQEAVIRAALADGRVAAGDVDLIEAHGTGTALGDPIELKALASVYCRERSQDRPLVVGSVKTNIGHLESAAGVAGLIKVVLSLQHGEIPRHLHFHDGNPHFDWNAVPMVVPSQPRSWTNGHERIRLAGVSSFGFSGTNAHVILQAAPAADVAEAAIERPLHLLTLSSKSSEALHDLARRYSEILRDQPDVRLADAAFTANTGRSHFSHRLAVIADTRAQARAGLEAFSENREHPSLRTGEARANGAPEVAFLFTGQGAQYAGMGRRLFDTHPAFRSTLLRCEELLRPHLDRPLLSVMFPQPGDEHLLDQTMYTQPALFSLEVALYELWRSWGVEPSVVMGHSLGEDAAACVAGVFSLEQGLALIAARGRLMQELADDGEMVTVFAEEARVVEAVKRHGGVVTIAAVNGPRSVAISGLRTAVREVAADFERQGVRVKAMSASRAFHSPLMDPMLDSFGAVASTLQYAAPQIPIVSNVTGDLAAGDEMSNADYWQRHVREAVKFCKGMQTLHRIGCSIFIEIGPGSTLVGMGRRCLADDASDWLPSIRRDRDDWQEILASLGTAYTRAVPIDWRRFDGEYRRRKVALPTYPFQRERYWTDASIASAQRTDVAADAHPLLGRRVPSAVKETLFERRLSVRALPFLADHQVFGSVLFPATGYVELGMAAAAEVLGSAHYVVENLSIADPLVIGRDQEITIQVIAAPDETDGAVLQIFSCAEAVDGRVEQWRLHASAVVRRGSAGAHSDSDSALDTAKSATPNKLSADDQYLELRGQGVEYGAAFRGLTELWQGKGAALGLVHLPDSAGEMEGFHLHPALLDACLHVVGPLLKEEAGTGAAAPTYLPVTVDRVRLLRTPSERVWSYATVRGGSGRPETVVADLFVFDESGAVVATIEGLHLKRATREALRRAARSSVADWLYEITWQPRTALPAQTDGTASGTWLLLGDDSDLANQIAQRLASGGASVLIAEASDRYETLANGRVRLNPVAREDFERLVRESVGEGGAIAGIVSLWLATPDRTDPSIETIENAQRLGCGSLLSIVQALVQHGVAPLPRLWNVTRGAQPAESALANPGGSSSWGLARTIASEYPDLKIVSVDLDASEGAGDVEAIWAELRADGGESEVAYRNRTRYVARLGRRTLAPPRGAAASQQPVRLVTRSRGILDNLQLQQVERQKPGPGEVEIRVAATGLNFRDVLNALGMYPGDPGPLGNECAGTIVALGPGVEGLNLDDEVAALGVGTFSSFVTVPAATVARKAPRLTFDEAATIPITFLTADWGLNNLARLQRGERVLIHAAAGGVGLAAVQLAERAGAEIFATAGSEEKRAFLQSLGITHVMNSRTVDFADEILRRTGGAGVDVVLNSLNGDAIPASLRALRTGGRFLEIGKNGIWSAGEMAAARPDVEYSIIFLGDVEPAIAGKMLSALMADLEAGKLQPLPLKAFPLADAVAAFRHMAQAKHIGKVVITQAQRDQDSTAPAIRRDGTYLLTGGAGGLGVPLARWLIERGAGNIVLMGRRAPAAATIDELAASGAHVEFSQGDVSREEDVRRVFAGIAATMPPLRGVFHLAGVLDDGVLVQQTWDRFEKVMAPKITGAWHLHELSGPLDYFVLFSSFASVLGSAGQSNYAASNAFLDGLAHFRRARGLPAVSINWGNWAGGGMAARLSAQDHRRFEAQGIGTIQVEQGLAALDDVLHRSTAAQIGVLAADWSKVLAQSSLLAEIVPVAPSSSASRRQAEPASLLAQVRQLPAGSRAAAFKAHVREQAIRVLGLDRGFALDTRVGLRDLGLDSLMALELRNRLQRSLGETLPSTLAFDCPTVDALTDFLVAKFAPAVESEAEPKAEASRTQSADEPIAIVGMACRFPGAADTPEAFWELLRGGVDAITDVPGDRWNADAFYDPDASAPGKMQTRWGGFLDGVDQFDPQFFGIAPREAVFMDPQQRLLLEVTWEALERAGQAPDALTGSKTGVFVGISTNDYLKLQVRSGDASRLTAYSGTGSSLSVAAGRLSYTLGLQGPSLSIDTACSSSLVAIHLACQSLRSGECRVAIAGGVNLILAPEVSVVLSKGNMMSPTGRCKTFDASADGYVRGEGCGIIVLKRLSEAIAAGDHVLAVVKGTAVNQDGRSSGLTVPSGPAQEALIREALAAGGVQPNEVDYVEAHGTGTSLGDPIEVRALSAVLGANRPADRKLLVGSVKTNVGHLESAAGVASLIKTVLALQHAEIPPSLHFTTPNPHIAWSDVPVEVATAPTPWVRKSARRVAGVSSFGFSGTNAHVVVEEAPAIDAAAPQVDRPVHLAALSAKTPAALGQLAARLGRYIDEHPDASAADIAFTANTGRAQLDARAAAVVSTIGELRQQLDAIATARPAEGLIRQQQSLDASRPEVAFLFTGQGAQYAGMTRRLYETQATFRRTIDRCDELLRPLMDRPLLSVLYPEERDAALIDQTAYTQPALFAVEYAIAELWQSWGVRPTAVLGHSVGEYAAACVAGVFSLEDGLAMIAARGRLMQQLPAGGAMAAVFADEARVRAALAKHAFAVSIAALNGPDNTSISGPTAEVDAVLGKLAEAGIGAERLKVSHAFHSALMEPMLDAFATVANRVTFAAPRISLVSNLTGKVAAPDEMATASYWVRQLREPVRFGEGLVALKDLGYRAFVEVGPSPVLSGIGRRSFDDPAIAWLASLRKTREDCTQMLGTLGELWTRGVDVDFKAFDRDYARRKLVLPTSPFERQRYWLDLAPPPPSRSVAEAARAIDVAAIESRCAETIDGGDWRSRLRADGLVVDGRDEVVSRIVRRDGEALADLRFSPGGIERTHGAIVDICARLMQAALPAGETRALVLVGCDRLELSGRLGSNVRAHVAVRSVEAAGGAVVADIVLGDERGRVRGTLTGLTLATPAAEAEEHPLDGWTYAVSWTKETPAASAAKPAARTPQSWLLFADRAGVGSSLAQFLRARGEVCRIVVSGDAFNAAGPDAWQVRPDCADDFEKVLRTIRDSPTPCTRIVFMWALDAAIESSSAEVDPDEVQSASVGSALYLVQAMRHAEVAATLRIVTRNAQVLEIPDAGSAVNAAQSMLWGLGRVIGAEHPALWGGLIDVDAPADDTLDELIRELDRVDAEDQVALRHGSRYVARLERVAVPPAAPLPIKSDGAYVVTGGLGLLGLEIARWLAENGARHLTLVGRTGLPDRELWSSLPKDAEAYRRARAVEAIERLGVTVETAAIDVTNEDQLRTYFDRFGRTAPALRGVVHAASASGSARLMELDIQRLDAMLRPKVGGTWALHRATASSDLDFFVLFSSVAAVLGSLEMAHYAAANSFLDGFAHYRRSLGLPAVSINWGAWEGVRESAERRRLFESSGMHFMPIERALAAFGCARTSELSQLMIADVDWKTFKPVYEATRRRPFLDSIDADTPAAAASPARESLVGLLDRTSVEDRWAVLSAQIRAEVAAVLALPVPQVDTRKGLFDLGMDSLMSVELKSRLEVLLGQVLPTTLTFKYPTVMALTDFLADRLGVEKSNGAAPAPSDAQPAAPGDELSEDDLATLLLERLGQIR